MTCDRPLGVGWLTLGLLWIAAAWFLARMRGIKTLGDGPDH